MFSKPLLTSALDVSGGWVGHVLIMRSFVNDPQTIRVWAEMGELLLRERLDAWSASGESVVIFKEFSTMVMTIVMYTIMRPQFTEKYSKQLISLI